MKKTLSILLAMAFAAVALAQTPQEIISRMEEEMTRHENEGIVMTVDIKIPIVGTVTSKVYTLGDKQRLEAKMLGVDFITWTDNDTQWEYNTHKNEVEIKNLDPATNDDASGDAGMFSGLADGYDLSIQKETADAWHILCKKSKTNGDKDDPKTINLVVNKGTYHPKSLKTKMSGMTMTMRDIAYGVKERQVTFHPEDYPGLTIIDSRQ